MLNILNNPWILLALFVVSMAIGAIWAVKKSKRKEEKTTMKVQSAVVASVVALAVLMFTLPTLSIDIEGIFTYAFDIVNAFMPLIAIVAGLGLGFNLVTKIGGLFQKAL
jgi:cytochrome bd-type quinol oxidase subunit 2